MDLAGAANDCEAHPEEASTAAEDFSRSREGLQTRRGRALHEILRLAPWEISPLRVAGIPEPDLHTCHDKIWFSSWWKAMRLREELEAVVIAREE